MKKIILTLSFILTITNSYSQNKYTVNQVMDSLSKYENPFRAFKYLDKYYIPYDSIRNNKEFKKKSLQLFNRDIFIKYTLNREKESSRIILFDYSKRSMQLNFYKNEPQSFIDSIYNDKIIRFKILDSIHLIRSKEIEKEYKNYEYILFNDYILMHSKLFYQEAYNQLREYYDKEYGVDAKFDSRSDLMLALINLGDLKVRKVFDNYFKEKTKEENFIYDDIIDIKHFISSYKYEKYLTLLNYKYKVWDGWSDGETYHPIRCYIAKEYFPVIDNRIDWETKYKIQDEMLGENILSTNDCKPLASWETVKDYFQEYINSEKQKENKKNNLLNYKN